MDDLGRYAGVFAVAAGLIHGVGMANRKIGGRGHGYWETGTWYFENLRWWLGFCIDGIAGLCALLAFTYITVEVCIPVILAMELLTGYLISVFYFRDPTTRMQVAGFVLSLVAVLLLLCVHRDKAALIPVGSFFDRWTFTPVLVVNAVWLCVVIVIGFASTRAVLCVVVGAYADTIQYVCTRTLGNALVQEQLTTDPWQVVAASVIKCCCICTILHCQQLALDTGFDLVAIVYPLCWALMTCSIGASFFGDSVEQSPGFIASVTCALCGFALLSYDPRYWESKEQEAERRSITLRASITNSLIQEEAVILARASDVGLGGDDSRDKMA
jgi:hypothetical protein